MTDDPLAHRGLPPPPPGAGDELFAWVAEVARNLGVTLLDQTPMAALDRERLTSALGEPPAELTVLYARSTPWDDRPDGVADWLAHLERLRGRLADDKLAAALSWQPLWPLSVARDRVVAGFADDRGRLAIIDATIGRRMGAPLALGLRSYLVMIAVVEALCDEQPELDYFQVMRLPVVSAIGGWPADDPPRHRLIDRHGQS